MMNMENKDNLKEHILKEIEIIQDIIKRMASNFFMISVFPFIQKAGKRGRK